MKGATVLLSMKNTREQLRDKNCVVPNNFDAKKKI